MYIVVVVVVVTIMPKPCFSVSQICHCVKGDSSGKRVTNIQRDGNLMDPVKVMVDTICTQMSHRFHKIEAQILLSEAAALDPRFKRRPSAGVRMQKGPISISAMLLQR